MMPLCIPHPDSLRPCKEEVSSFIRSYSIRHAVTFPLLVSKYVLIGQSCRRGKVKNPDIPLVAIVYIKLSAVGREGQAIGLRHVLNQQLHMTLFTQAIHALKRDL